MTALIVAVVVGAIFLLAAISFARAFWHLVHDNEEPVHGGSFGLQLRKPKKERPE